jgi:hypothetical protein
VTDDTDIRFTPVHPFSRSRHGGLARPVVDVFVHGPKNTAYTRCLVDSGADVALFDAMLGIHIGLDVQAGRARLSRGISPVAVPTWEHDVELTVLGHRFPASVGFAYALEEEFGLLGLTDAFTQFLFAFDCTGQRLLARRARA